MTDHERQDAIHDEIGHLLSELSKLRSPEDDPIVIGWAVAYEWTSVRLEQDDRYGVSKVTPRTQSGSMTVGLFQIGYNLCTDNEGDDQ